MKSVNYYVPVSDSGLWTGRILSGVAVLFMLFDSITKIMMITPVVKATVQMGFSSDTVATIGGILLVCTLVYIIPHTSILGAILLTGYLGGAVASNLRLENPLFSHTLFPIYIAVLIWGGLVLRDGNLKAIIFFHREFKWSENN